MSGGKKSFREAAIALIDLINLRFKNNTFPIENILIHINNKLEVRDKFYTTTELSSFAESIIHPIPQIGLSVGDIENRINAIKEMLSLFFPLFENKEYNEFDEFSNLKSYYKKLGKEVKKVSEEEIVKNEDSQWSHIRNQYLNHAQEQIIFNYKPAEIGEDSDPRTKKLRRDLIRNLGLVTGIDYSSIDDLKNNRKISCNYVFVVPSKNKAEEIWIGVLKELVRTIHELSKSISGISLNRQDIFEISVDKLESLCKESYNVKGQTFFDISRVNVPTLNPLSVFTAADIYCWAPTVVLTTSSEEVAQKGFIIFQDKDVGVAEMTDEVIILWCEKILSVLTDQTISKQEKFSRTQIMGKKTEILQAIKCI